MVMIGVIDSGIGGLHVVAALRNALPAADIVYYADTARAPYGSRSAEMIVAGALEGVERVWRSGARVLVAASHTIATVAWDALARRLGDALFDVASVAAEMAVDASRRKRIGLVASRATAGSRRYEEMIRGRCPEAEVFVAACPLWAPLVEEGWLKRRETALIVKRGVRAVKQRGVDALILGSSGFIGLERVVQRKIGPQVALVEASERLAARVAERLRLQKPPPAGGGRRLRLLVSDLTPLVAQAARAICGREATLERAA
jgi:glutamate racemase